MKPQTEKQIRTRKHNWLRLRLAGSVSSLKAIINSDTTTSETKNQANGILDLIEELDEMLVTRVD